MPDTPELENIEPAGGDGGDATSANDTPWNEYIGSYVETVPELHRDVARDAALAAAKHVEGLTTQRFQEAADFRKRFEPFAELGLPDRDPEAVSTYLNIGEALEPGSESARDVLEKIAALHGLQLSDVQPDEGDGTEDPEADRIAQLEQRFAEQEQEKQNQQIQSQIAASLEAVEKDNGGPLTDDEQEQLLTAAQGFVGQPDPVRAAWEMLKSWRTSAQQELVKHKQQEPGGADTGPSRPVAGLPKVSGSMADAEAEVLALVQGLNP